MKNDCALDILDVLRPYILDRVMQQGNVVLSTETKLIENGYLTSLQVVELIMFLEDHYDIEIDPDDVTEENFQTLESIAQLVDAQRKAADAS